MDMGGGGTQRRKRDKREGKMKEKMVFCDCHQSLKVLIKL